MTDKNIQIQDLQGNNLYPKTKGSVVLNNAGKNLGGVEENAQQNKIETIKVNGVSLQIVSKAVDINIPSVPVYSISKLATAESGYSATYELTADGVATGEKNQYP